jgi:hypothetical protein
MFDGEHEDCEGELYFTVINGEVHEVTDCNEVVDDAPLTFADNIVRGFQDGLTFRPCQADRVKFPIVGRRSIAATVPRINKLPRF